MALASIPVDVFNPGQVFACLGLMELAEVLCGDTEAGFDWSDPSDTRFLLRTQGDGNPVEVGIRFLAQASVTALTPVFLLAKAEARKGLKTDAVRPGSAFPCPTPEKPANLPAVLSTVECAFTIDSWADVNALGFLSTRRDNVKFWSGSGGKPGALFVSEALDLIRPHVDDALVDPFNLSAPQSGSLRFDWRRDYIPLQLGFSLNEHKSSIVSRGYPMVEVLAAIGVAHARPLRENKLLYHYSIQTGGLLPALFVRSILGGAALPFPTRNFTMHLDWPGQEGKARCITTVSEEFIL